MTRRTLLGLILSVGLLAVSAWPVLATDANGNHDNYQFVSGMPPVEGPDVASAPNGSTVALQGTGTFHAGPGNTASGGGTYTIKDASGHTLASGAFKVTGVLGFVDYGPGTPQGTPPNIHGGEGKFNVTLAGVGSGVLTVTCLLGSPPAGKNEGVTLILGNGMNFTKSTSGETAYILQYRHGASERSRRTSARNQRAASRAGRSHRSPASQLARKAT